MTKKQELFDFMNGNITELFELRVAERVLEEVEGKMLKVNSVGTTIFGTNLTQLLLHIDTEYSDDLITIRPSGLKLQMLFWYVEAVE